MRRHLVFALIATFGSLFVCNVSSNSAEAMFTLFGIFTLVVALWASLGWRALGGIWSELDTSNEKRRRKVRKALDKYKDLYYDEES